MATTRAGNEIGKLKLQRGKSNIPYGASSGGEQRRGVARAAEASSGGGVAADCGGDMARAAEPSWRPEGVWRRNEVSMR